jgi:hypothetical protein
MCSTDPVADQMAHQDKKDAYNDALWNEQYRLANEALEQARGGNFDALRGVMDYPGMENLLFDALFDAANKGHAKSALAITKLMQKYGETHAEVEE